MAKKKVFTPPEPRMQVRSKCLLFYRQFPHTGSKNIIGFSTGTYSGIVTDGAAKRIRKAVDILLQISSKRKTKNPATDKLFNHWLSFITLTIPARDKHVNVKYANQFLLAPFIRKMRTKHTMTTYVWKAEFQLNGQLHYHITTPSVIHHTYIKNTWNNILSGAGLLQEHFKRHDNKFPNSTDIHEVQKNDKFNWYLSKEISKSQQDKKQNTIIFPQSLFIPPIIFANKNINNFYLTNTPEKADGKIWDCSLNIKTSKFFSTNEPSDFPISINPNNVLFLSNCEIFKTSEPLKYLPIKYKEQYHKWQTDVITKPELIKKSRSKKIAIHD